MVGRWLLVCLMVARTLSDSCLAPSLENGEVEGKGTDNGWTGSFSCNPGFILVGSSRLKCMMGGSVARWSSASFPVCAAMGKCDPSRLPSVENGELVSYRPRKFRSSVYKYHCAVGYTIFGPSLVHCSAGGTWDLRHPPVCAKPGCDESLVSSITLGQAKRKAHGGVYVFRCSPGSQLEGPSTLVCDGHNWNSTAPTCLIGPEKVSIGGADTLLQGQASGFSCVSSPSNPPAEIQWGAKDVHGDAVDHLLQEGESSSSWAGSGWETTSTVMLHPESGLTSLTLTCSATNPTLGHTATSHKRVLIQFAPEGVTVSGSARVRAGQEVHLTCKSTRSVPASSLHWTVTQGDHTMQHTPGDQVKQLEDGSFTTHSHLTLKALPAADLVAECFATSPVLGADSVAYAHVVEIISPPGVPTISGVVPSAQVQHLNCSTSAGKPPASLSWFRGSEMMASHYSVEGDTVSAIITFVPSHTDQEELTCEASNDALSEPVRNTITIQTPATTSTTTSSTTQKELISTTVPWVQVLPQDDSEASADVEAEEYNYSDEYHLYDDDMEEFEEDYHFNDTAAATDLDLSLLASASEMTEITDNGIEQFSEEPSVREEQEGEEKEDKEQEHEEQEEKTQEQMDHEEVKLTAEDQEADAVEADADKADADEADADADEAAASHHLDSSDSPVHPELLPSVEPSNTQSDQARVMEPTQSSKTATAASKALPRSSSASSSFSSSIVTTSIVLVSCIYALK